LKGREKINYIFHCISKGMHEYKWGQGRCTKKVPKGSKAKTQAHATKGGRNTKGIIEELEALHVART
jgi:hypothetical protein